MKTEFRSRPVFLRNWERIRAHFTTCFMALLVFRLLEFKINEKAGTTIPAGRIIQALRDMNLNKIGLPHPRPEPKATAQEEKNDPKS